MAASPSAPFSPPNWPGRSKKELTSSRDITVGSITACAKAGDVSSESSTSRVCCPSGPRKEAEAAGPNTSSVSEASLTPVFGSAPAERSALTPTAALAVAARSRARSVEPFASLDALYAVSIAGRSAADPAAGSASDAACTRASAAEVGQRAGNGRTM
eukprot:scaffold3262_cov30-Tisochrysis_lutea.AAC.1